MNKITYTREDIARKLSYKINMNKNDSRIILDCMIDILKDLLIDDKHFSRIELRNFGVFDIVKTKKRSNARNPKTKESVIIPERKKVVFRASKYIKKQLYKSV